MSGLAWEKNDELFRRELSVGYGWACRVADVLNDFGVACHVGDLDFRDGFEDRVRFENEQDVVLDGQSGCIEVKSRRLVFSGEPSSFPYGTALVDTKVGWLRKSPQPLAVVLVSQFTGEFLVVPVSTRDRWGLKRSQDRVRRIEETWFTVDRGLLRRFDDLVEWLGDRAIR